MSDPRVLLEKDHETHIARLTLNHPERKNCYDPVMRRAIGAAMDDVATDDDIKVLLLRGAGSVFCTGADMRNAYSWYETKGDERRPSQRRKLAVDRESFSFYHDYIGYPKATVAQIEGYALGGGFELALASDISVASRDAKVGMPAARFLGPVIGNVHLFFHRLGPVLAKRLLLTGETFLVSEGAAVLAEQRVPGLVLDLARANRGESPPPGDWMFLVSGDSLQMVLTGNESPGTQGSTSYEGWGRLPDQSELPWRDVNLSWTEMRAFERARRDVPVRWHLRSSDGEMEGDLVQQSANLEAGTGAGPGQARPSASRTTGMPSNTK